MPYNPCAPMKGVPLSILVAASTINTLSTVLAPGQGIRNHTIDILVSASVPGVAPVGSLALETAESPDAAAIPGWALLGGSLIDLNLIVVPAGQTVGRMSVSFSEQIINALRGRLATAVTGGTVYLSYTGQ